jgi:hypothetical protein
MRTKTMTTMKRKESHYVAIVRQGEDWYLVDDAKLPGLAEKAALQLLGGHENTVTSRGSYMRVFSWYTNK